MHYTETFAGEAYSGPRDPRPRLKLGLYADGYSAYIEAARKYPELIEIIFPRPFTLYDFSEKELAYRLKKCFAISLHESKEEYIRRTRE